MSSALNTDLAPPIVKLLLEISQFRSRPLMSPLWINNPQLPFLPRTRYRHIILTPARWCFNYESLKLQKEASRSVVSKVLKSALEKYQVSDPCYLIYYDNRLLINWSIRDRVKLDVYAAHIIKRTGASDEDFVAELADLANSPDETIRKDFFSNTNRCLFGKDPNDSFTLPQAIPTAELIEIAGYKGHYLPIL